MRTKFLSAILINFTWIFAAIPLPSSPSWQSQDLDYSTGGGFGDIDTNRFIDYVTTNGNDMASNRNAIYYNHNGTIEPQASWRSQDLGYFGHLYLGDVTGDGLEDMTVVYLGFGSSNQGPTRIYKNRGGGLETTPFWQSSDRYNSFDCCLGDVDLDGDLDLAVAAGDPYNNVRSPVRIYRNNRGLFENTPYWTSADSTPSDALRFLDINDDGFLDLIVGYRRKVSIFINQNGTLPRQATFSFRDKGWVLRIAVGDYDKDGWVDFAIASNGQLSGDISQVAVFKNRAGVIDTIPVFRMLRNRRYSSCVAFGDCNGDGFPELAAGGWWEPICVFENRGGQFDTIPTWSYAMGQALVCETAMWGCVANDHLQTSRELKIGDGTRKLFRVLSAPVQFLREVAVNNNPLPCSLFTFDPLSGYISLPRALGQDETLKITYSFSSYLDLGVTNWDQTNGNLLFINTSPPVALKEIASVRKSLPRTTLVRDLLPISETIFPFVIYDTQGRIVAQISQPTKEISVANLKPGIYFISGSESPVGHKRKIIKL